MVSVFIIGVIAVYSFVMKHVLSHVAKPQTMK
jgi:hypothetical protein